MSRMRMPVDLTHVEMSIVLMALRAYDPVDSSEVATVNRARRAVEAAREALEREWAPSAAAANVAACPGVSDPAPAPPLEPPKPTDAEFVAGLVWEGDSLPGVCPDNGTCHHGCSERGALLCYRVMSASPLSGVFRDNRWPCDGSVALAPRSGSS